MTPPAEDDPHFKTSIPLVRSGNRVGLFNLLLVTRTNTMRGEKAPDSPPLPTFNPPPTRRALAFEDNRQRHERGWRTWIGRIVAKLTEASSVPSDGMAGESESVSLGGRFREDAGAPTRSLMSVPHRVPPSPTSFRPLRRRRRYSRRTMAKIGS